MEHDNENVKRAPGRPSNPVKRETLLEVASEQFANSGFAGTSMNDIASQVGLRKSSLFHHFDNKNKLYHEVVIGIVKQLGDRVRQAASHEGSYRERLDHLSGSVTDFLSAQPWSSLLVVREALDGHLFSEDEGAATVGEALQRITRFLQAGMKDQIFIKDDPRKLAFSIVSLHLLPFAAASITSPFFGGDVFGPEAVADLRSRLAAQTRRLCGLPSDE